MPPGPARRITLKDVAAELGVSAKTVSNAYARPDQLSADLRRRVLAAAHRLGYPGPDPLAAGLRRGRVGAIGVAYDNGLSYAFSDPVAVQVLAGVSAVAEPAGAGLLLVPGSVDVRRSTAAVTGALVDGLVVCSLAEDDPVLAAAAARRLPLAVIDQPRPAVLRTLGPGPLPWVGIDDRTAAARLAGHLLGLGHRRLGVVCFGLRRTSVRQLVDLAGQESATYPVTRDRLAGYRDAATAAGVDWSAVPVAEGTDSTVEEGEAGAAAVLATEPRPTALLCLSDRLAEGALRAAARRGLRVPDDLSVVGFDDAEPAGRLGLTTVAQPHRRKGEVAAGALLTLLAGGRAELETLLPTDLVVRTSTAPPR
jgi:DNA-binding LacI/PurR family transcriptional regulator